MAFKKSTPTRNARFRVRCHAQPWRQESRSQFGQAIVELALVLLLMVTTLALLGQIGVATLKVLKQQQLSNEKR